VTPACKVQRAKVCTQRAWEAQAQKQVEKFVAFSEADPQAAISAVNDEEEDPTACGVANLAYVRGHNALTIRTRDATFQIADILVIGVITDDGARYSVGPILFVQDRRARSLESCASLESH
jgi:hypothetical protein